MNSSKSTNVTVDNFQSMCNLVLSLFERAEFVLLLSLFACVLHRFVACQHALVFAEGCLCRSFIASDFGALDVPATNGRLK